MIIVSFVFHNLIFARPAEQGNEQAEVCRPIFEQCENPWLESEEPPIVELSCGMVLDEAALSEYSALDPFIYEPTKITSEQVRQITADMNYFDIVDVLGQTTSFAYGNTLMQYVVDEEYILHIPYFLGSRDEPIGFTGEELLTQLTEKY